MHRFYGRLKQVIGTTVESIGPPCSVGDLCYIKGEGERQIAAEVVGFKDSRVILMPFQEMGGIQPGNMILSTRKPFKIGVAPALLGRVLGALGEPLDGKPPVVPEKYMDVFCLPPPPLERTSIDTPLSTGVRAIDGLLTVGKGQRIGIFAGSGVGKSTTLGMIARNTVADINVIALIGERGREVPEFLERDLGEEGLRKSVVVAVTSDKPPLLRIKGALVATAIAEYFKDLGNDVLLMMDSATRIAMAQREIGLAVGEPPTTRGYTPSVFALLPQILERSGSFKKGTITGIYTVLVEGDDMNDPIADAMRAILDGHIVLSRKLAHKNHYPSIDILSSISRVMSHIITPDHKKSAARFRNVLAKYRDSEDLINIGAYAPGSNREIDYAIEKIDSINGFLLQSVDEKNTYSQITGKLIKIFE
ncbi:MAG: flagellar protein export ATPase FliI [Firmicutes bacterium]|nr:flagellar protein export ATPase FliI [Bacillota bacterium]